MTEGTANQPQAEPAPINDMDIDCPECGYNLRGLTERRCPECGLVVDFEELRRQYEQYGMKGPPLRWVIPTILRHPVAFWSMPQVRLSPGPDGDDLPTMALWAAAMIVLPPIIGWPLEAASPLIMALPVLLAVLLLVLLHSGLCRIVTRPEDAQSRLIGAWGVTTYSLTWGGIGFGLASAAAVVSDTIRSSPSGEAIVVALLACAAAANVLWAVTLYHGGLLICRGSRWRALWCVISNPFWWPVWVVILALLLAG